MSSRSRTLVLWLSFASVVLIASTMRSPIVGLSGVLDQVVADLNLSALVAGSLTTIPVLAFAVCTPLAAYVIRSMGYRFAITLTLLGIALGIVVRSVGTTPMVIVGTALIGLFITLGNVTMPVMIRARFPFARRGMATALYTTALNLGAMAMLLAIVPLTHSMGWKLGLGIWVIHVGVAFAVWITTVGFKGAFRVAGGSRGADPSPTSESVTAAESTTSSTVIEKLDPVSDAMVGSDPLNPSYVKDLRFRLVVMTIAFGFQSFCYYSVTAWLPQILAAGADMNAQTASSAASIFQVSATIGAFGIPVMARFMKYNHLALSIGFAWLIFTCGLLFAPALWVAWLISAGIAQGGAFTLVMLLMVQLAKNDREAARYSALIQGIGYGIAAVGPTLLGYVFDRTGGWDGPLYVVLGAVGILSCALYLATRDSAHIRYK